MLSQFNYTSMAETGWRRNHSWKHLVLWRTVFFLDSFVNKQNWNIWGTENLQLAVPSSLHPSKSWFESPFPLESLLGPFLNIKRLVQQYIWTFSKNFSPFKMLWRMVGIACSLCKTVGAPPHRTAAEFDFLNDHFGDYIIALDYEKHTQSGMDWSSYLSYLNSLGDIIGSKIIWVQ